MNMNERKADTRELWVRGYAYVGSMLIVLAIIFTALGFNPFPAKSTVSDLQLCPSHQLQMNASPPTCYDMQSKGTDYRRFANFSLLIMGICLIAISGAMHVKRRVTL